MKIKKVRELFDIVLEEVSVVDKAANKKTFLFFKQKGVPAKQLKKKRINIVIDSDGTIGGTKIYVNKEELEDLRDFSFSFWGNDDAKTRVSASYTKATQSEDGFSRTETFYLSKGELQMNEELKKALQEYFGKDVEIDFKKAIEDDVISKALKTVIDYQEEFPDDLNAAVGALATQATMFQPVAKKDDKEDDDDDDKSKLKKAGAKLSKDTLKKLEDALAAIKSVLPELTGTEKSDKTEKSDVQKMIDELTESIEKLEKKGEKADDDESTEKLVKALDKIAKRLKKVEETSGVKKSLEDQDDDEEENGDGKWPSISGKK